ncbi:GNAT family N-acetyltransferase [Microvirga roseola]|uniref:GNAT family N-acetyltransferase n=1 Tax=Microvirga roseola TaxID=2883126 RepID=UPI001E393712|nr:GNAT family N-acetyltransferase [Microvirga roseola]
MTYVPHYPTAFLERVEIPGRSRILIRPVIPQDADEFRLFVRILSGDSRRNRFHSTLTEIPETLLRALTNVDHNKHVALVAKAVDESGVIIIGEARFAREEEDSPAEIAIAVADRWRRKGIGTLLLHRLEISARRRGVEEMFGSVLAENVALIHLAFQTGFKLHTGDTTYGVVKMYKKFS